MFYLFQKMWYEINWPDGYDVPYLNSAATGVTERIRIWHYLVVGPDRDVN